MMSLLQPEIINDDYFCCCLEIRLASGLTYIHAFRVQLGVRLGLFDEYLVDWMGSEEFRTFFPDSNSYINIRGIKKYWNNGSNNGEQKSSIISIIGIAMDLGYLF